MTEVYAQQHAVTERRLRLNGRANAILQATANKSWKTDGENLQGQIGHKERHTQISL